MGGNTQTRCLQTNIILKLSVTEKFWLHHYCFQLIKIRRIREHFFSNTSLDTLHLCQKVVVTYF